MNHRHSVIRFNGQNIKLPAHRSAYNLNNYGGLSSLKHASARRINGYDLNSHGGLASLAKSVKLRNLERAVELAWAEAHKYTQADNPRIYASAKRLQNAYESQKIRNSYK
jgi:hypothetical protein